MKRELSPFFCKELLPSHLEGLLDATRKEAVEEMLAKNEDLKLTFDSMKSKIKFLESLSEVEPHSVWIEKVNDPRQPWKIQVKKWAWSSWSETAQWSFQLFVVGVLVMITVRFVPWLNLARTFQNAKPTAPTLNPVVAVEDSMEVCKGRKGNTKKNLDSKNKCKFLSKDSKYCTICGCNLSLKSRFKTDRCDIGKWDNIK
jgi:hypothetical protein